MEKNQVGVTGLDISRIFLTFAIGTVGGLAGYKLKIPAGAMIGSLLAVAAFNMLWGPLGKMPNSIILGVQIILGSALGLSFTRGLASDLKSAWLPALIIAGAYLLASLLIAFAVAKVTGWDWLTSLFSAVPGGLGDVVAVAQTVEGVKPINVMVMHSVRLAMVLLSLPVIIKLFGK